MSGNPILMSQLKQIIRLLSQGYSLKGIVRETGVARNTIKSYLRTIEAGNITMEEILKMDDLLVAHLLNTPLKNEKQRKEDFMLRLEKLQTELQHPHVTKQLLWEEYKREYPGGYQYSQFCYYLDLYDKSQRATLVMEHEIADKVFVDFTGDKLHYVDRGSGENIPCEVFLATMGYSNYTSVGAVHSQKIPDIVTATVNALNYIGGSPRAIVPDCLKSAVTTADRYEPVINEVFLDMANHYGMVVLPARAGKPKDKSKVERAVTISYQRVFAPLRKLTFYSLQELNTALAEQATILNQRKMQQSDHCREVLLERDERPLLKPLPEEPYEIKQHLVLTVQQNCHVYFSKQKKYYSAPYRFIGFKVHVIITPSLVRIYYQGECVATHSTEQTSKYNTIKEHLPSHHQIVLNGMNQESLKERARSIGAPVLEVIERILRNSIHPEQAYKSCQGILVIANKTSKEILLQSCVIALQYNVCTYRNIQRLALGQYANREFSITNTTKQLPVHENVRGAKHFN
jgi:transposase